MTNGSPSHLDLFSGLGGFAIAAQQAGFETVAFCEIDKRCRSFLEKTWRLPVYPDIRELHGRDFQGINLWTGGPPCQPASRAGKQKGKGDDRWLWEPTIALVEEGQPDAFVFENPLGIYDVGLDGILSQLEGCGYEVRPFDIPACAVNSPQLRHRFWIVGFRKNLGDSDSRGLGTWQGQQKPTDGGRSIMANSSWNSERGIRETAGADRKRDGKSPQQVGSNLAHSPEPRHQGRDTERASHGRGSECPEGELADSATSRRNGETGEEQHFQRSPLLSARPGDSDGSTAWQNFVWVPCADGKLRRAPDESFYVAHGLHRSVLAALGNSILPQAAYPILKAVKEVIWQSP